MPRIPLGKQRRPTAWLSVRQQPSKELPINGRARAQLWRLQITVQRPWASSTSIPETSSPSWGNWRPGNRRNSRLYLDTAWPSAKTVNGWAKLIQSARRLVRVFRSRLQRHKQQPLKGQ